jgi:TPR repeat protein
MKGEVITADTLLAADYYRQAALGNSGEALYKYALYMKQTGIERDTLLGSIHDCNYHGHGVKRDKSLAKDLYREAAAAGNEDAVRILQEW